MDNANSSVYSASPPGTPHAMPALHADTVRETETCIVNSLVFNPLFTPFIFTAEKPKQLKMEKLAVQTSEDHWHSHPEDGPDNWESADYFDPEPEYPHFPFLPGHTDYVVMYKRTEGERPRSWPLHRLPKHKRFFHKPASSTHTPISEDDRHQERKWQEYRHSRLFDVHHGHELSELIQEGVKKAGFRAAGRASYETVDMNAFSDTNRDRDIDKASEKHKQTIDEIPDCLPQPYMRVDSPKELGQYMAASSYVAALTGAPVPDLRYGIIIVPCGDERLFFSQQQKGMSAEEIQDVYAKSKNEIYPGWEPALFSPSQAGPSMDSAVFQFYDTKVRREEWLRRNATTSSDTTAWNDAAPVFKWPSDDGQDAGQGHGQGDDHDDVQSSSANARTTVTDPTSVLSLEEISASQFRKALQSEKSESDSGAQIPAGMDAAPGAELPEQNGYVHDETLQAISKDNTSLKKTTVENGLGFESKDAPLDAGVGLVSIESTPSISPALQPLSPEGRVALEKMLEIPVDSKVGKKRSLKQVLRKLLRRKARGPGDEVRQSQAIHPMAFLEACQVLKTMEEGGISENPGIGQEIWEAPQMRLQGKRVMPE